MKVVKRLDVADLVHWVLTLKDPFNESNYEFVKECNITFEVNGHKSYIPMPSELLRLCEHCNISVAVDNMVGCYEFTGTESDMMNFRLSWDDSWGTLYG